MWKWVTCKVCKWFCVGYKSLHLWKCSCYWSTGTVTDTDAIHEYPKLKTKGRKMLKVRKKHPRSSEEYKMRWCSKNWDNYSSGRKDCLTFLWVLKRKESLGGNGKARAFLKVLVKPYAYYPLRAIQKHMIHLPQLAYVMLLRMSTGLGIVDGRNSSCW